MTDTVNKPWYSKAGEFLGKFDSYALAIIITLGVAAFLALFAIFFHDFPAEAVHSWLYDLLDGTYAYILISRALSGMGYVFKPVDIALGNVDPKAEPFQFDWHHIKASMKRLSSWLWNNITNHPGEFFGLVLGFTVGIGVSIACGLVGVKVNPLDAMKGVNLVMNYIGSISTYSGLFNRLGRSIDFYTRKVKEVWEEKWINRRDTNYAFSVVGGIAVGVALVAAFLACNLLPGGGLALAIVAIGVISTCASSSGYVGRLFDTGGVFHRLSFLKRKRAYDKNATAEDKQHTEKFEKDVKSKHKAECHGTAIGVFSGVILAAVLIGVGAATLPFFGLGLPLILAGVIVSGTCISVSGGLGNRIGYAVDKARAKKEAAADAATQAETQPLLANAPESEDALTDAPTPTDTLAPAVQQPAEAKNPVAASIPALNLEISVKPAQKASDADFISALDLAVPAESLKNRDQLSARMLSSIGAFAPAARNINAETYNEAQSKDFLPDPLENSRYTPIYSAGR